MAGWSTRHRENRNKVRESSDYHQHVLTGQHVSGQLGSYRSLPTSPTRGHNFKPLGLNIARINSVVPLCNDLLEQVCKMCTREMIVCSVLWFVISLGWDLQLGQCVVVVSISESNHKHYFNLFIICMDAIRHAIRYGSHQYHQLPLPLSSLH